ncbi:MAG: Spy/CpxP family protein refolding chaperone [Planctomycetota bacterium]
MDKDAATSRDGPAVSGDILGGFAKLLLGRIGDKLELTEEQRESIKAIFEANKENAKQSRKAVHEAMQALHEAAAEGTEAEIIAAGKASMLSQNRPFNALMS